MTTAPFWARISFTKSAHAEAFSQLNSLPNTWNVTTLRPQTVNMLRHLANSNVTLLLGHPLQIEIRNIL